MKLTVSTLRKIIKEEVEKTLKETAGAVDYYNVFFTALTLIPDLWDHDAQMAAASAVLDAKKGRKMDDEALQGLTFIFSNVEEELKAQGFNELLPVPVPPRGPEMISALKAFLEACKDFDKSQPVLDPGY